MKTSNRKNVKYKCPFCGKSYNRDSLVRHIGNKHEDQLPEGFTPLRYTFNYVNRKSEDYHGVCTECKRPTPWDENKGRYDRQCGSKACHDSFIKKFESNMMRTKGVTRISATVSGQEKMLANRKISGKYKFQDGVEKSYTGSYEKKALEFMDKVLNIKSSDIISPGPVFEYEYNGKKHIYITDFYYQPYNLVIEVKDGGDNPNNRNMPEYRAKQQAKEEFIVKNTDYNYLRLTNNNLEQLLAVFMDLKMQLVDDSNNRVIHINEGLAGIGPVVGIEDPDSAYIINYTKNNVFSDEKEDGIALADNIKFDHILARNKNGVLEETDKRLLYNAKYNVYKVQLTEDIKKSISEGKNNFVPYGFIYECIFGKTLYTNDQLEFTEGAVPVFDYYWVLEKETEIVRNRYLVSIPEDIECDENGIGLYETYITSGGDIKYILQLPGGATKDNYKNTSEYQFIKGILNQSKVMNKYE
jgi:hypothetical protein